MRSRIQALAEQWRNQAELYEADGFDPGAKILQRCADELEREKTAEELEELTIQQASTESGYSPSRLYELVSEGTIPNSGEKGEPRIQRRNLPRRPPGERNGSGPELVDDDLMEARHGGRR